jgi:Tol biopolymer transport system component
MQRVIDGVEYEMLIGWFPDSSALLYIVDTQESSSIRKLDLASGATSDLFTAQSGIDTSISPNGNEIAFGDVIADATRGLYVSRLDGSDRRLIGLWHEGDNWSFSGPVWSPDGKWLAVTIENILTTTNEITIVLVNPQTCQIVPLPVTGKVNFWLH